MLDAVGNTIEKDDEVLIHLGRPLLQGKILEVHDPSMLTVRPGQRVPMFGRVLMIVECSIQSGDIFKLAKD